MGLLDKIKASQPSRIVNLTSNGHEMAPAHLGGIDFDTLNDPTKTNAFTRYGRSKLANILFTKALVRRLANERVYVNAVHPGFASTQLARHTGDEIRSVMGIIAEKVTLLMAMTPKVGSLTELYVATSPEIENNNVRGRYFIPIANEIQPSALARDEELQEKLWTFSERLMNEKVKT
ncbi:Retinol dehydrogenase 13 [Linnemannia schmuckeri]|uniref:Retinol dehydrogenase 13 n=1 Tax=Linnemannia schmuckeri TaxID=64567 RepID=A0A9P5R923_9FUNG|nr:Retinol dehydrogenase 13 [Linnemannia schmuckeri]